RVDVIRRIPGEFGDQASSGYFQFSSLHIGQIEVGAAGTQLGIQRVSRAVDGGFTGTEFYFEMIKVAVGDESSGRKIHIGVEAAVVEFFRKGQGDTVFFEVAVEEAPVEPLIRGGD